MPSLASIGDAEAVDNRFIRKIVFYVEGREDEVLLRRYLFRDYYSDVEVKQPKNKGSGYHGVIARVASERTSNPRIFGIVDGETLIARGKIQEFIDSANCQDWIELTDVDGVYASPCWELENFFLSSRALESVIPHLGHVRSIANFSMEKFRAVLVFEAVRLSIWATLNYAMAASGKSLIRAETRTDVDGISKIRQETRRLEQANQIPRATAEYWRHSLANTVVYSDDRYEIYDQLLGRIDGKALYIRIKKRFRLREHIIGALANATGDVGNGVGSRLVDVVRRKLAKRKGKGGAV